MYTATLILFYFKLSNSNIATVKILIIHFNIQESFDLGEKLLQTHGSLSLQLP